MPTEAVSAQSDYGETALRFASKRGYVSSRVKAI